MTYMSRFSRPLSREEIDEIGRYSARRNADEGITGVLLTLGSRFFQIIEGDEQPLDHLYERVLRDERHTDIICLRAEPGVQDRLFPDWSMYVFDLDELGGDMAPLKVLLGRMSEAQLIIERYTQPAVSRIMREGRNPLEVPLRKVDRVVLFTDMVGYSAIASRLPVDEVSQLVNAYLEACSEGVSRQGGEVTKFLGDGMMAYFDHDAVDQALQACLDIQAELRSLRHSAAERSPLRLLHSGFGLALGPVIEGNMGSSVKMDYTIIGEPVNVAARLEELTRTTGTSILVTDEVCRAASGRWELAELGLFDLGGAPATVVHAVMTDEDRDQADLRSRVASRLEHILTAAD